MYRDKNNNSENILTMVNSLRKRHQITLFDMHAHPFVLLVTDVKVSGATHDVTNFFLF